MVNSERRSKPVRVSSTARETGRCALAGMDRRYTQPNRARRRITTKLSRQTVEEHRASHSRASTSGTRMTQLLDDPIVALAAVLVLLLILALVWAGSRRPFVHEIERLKEDLHRL